MILYRPVGYQELLLIKKSKFERFPPRLPQQPIFYPVLTEEYAAKIARDWNLKESGIGYVLQFNVSDQYLKQYQIQTVGGKKFQEYWIPAEDLENFNDAIIGKIKVVQTYQKWYVYILQCSDKTLYIGITNNLDKRIQKHNNGKGAKYTRGRRPVSLIKSFECASKSEALKLEYYLKQLSKEEKLNYVHQKTT